jgi:hypothetical protein
MAVRRQRDRAAGLAIVALSALVLAGCATLDRDDLASAVGELHSAAAEGLLVAREAHQHAVPKPFVWLESAQLLHQVEQIGDHIGAETVAAGLGGHVPRAHRIVDALTHAFIDLHDRPFDPRTSAQVAAVLAAQAEVSRRLEEELK